MHQKCWLEAKIDETFGTKKAEALLAYYEALKAGNQRQNLTRLIEPRDFFYGHLMDCWHYSQHFSLQASVDLGSGCGVPGLVLAILREEPWILIEKEKQKAAFLIDVASKLSPSTSVLHGRFQDHFKLLKGKRVTARALAPLGRLLKALEGFRGESVFFKGPSWESEQPGALPSKVIHYEIQDKKRCLLLFHVEQT